MVYSPHLKLTMSGVFTNNTGTVVEEIFSCQLNFGLSTSGSAPYATPWTQAQVNQIAATTGNGSPVSAISTFWGGAYSFINNQTNLNLIKWAAIGVDGRYTGNPAMEATGIHGGNTGAPVHPSDVACAVTLRTATRGSKGRGRFYLPSTDMPIDTTWHISGTFLSEMAQAVRQMCSDLTANIAGALTIPTADVALVVASSTGTNFPVTRVEVGNVYDTIRRRRNKLLESYL